MVRLNSKSWKIPKEVQKTPYHVYVAGEEADNAVWHHAAHLHQQVAVVTDDGGVITGLELAAHGNLVVPLAHNLGRV